MYSHRNNDSMADANNEIDVISSLRSERNVMSGIIQKIEEELFTVEYYYKMLLIERVKQERIF